MCYWENQLSRQAEHSSFHLFFPISEMFRGVHKQLRILKVTTVKQTKIYQKCVWGGSSTFVKEWCEAQKWKCENFTSVSVFIPACGAAALIPRIPKSHTISSPPCVCSTESTLCPTSSFLSVYPKPLFSLLSTAAPALCSSRRAVFFPHCLGHQQQSCQSVCGDSWWYFVWAWGCVCL